jgi:glycosyltransferase involved in cell wall biosynthesis
MKIAQVAPLVESVPPKLYGGTERVVSYLTEELVRLGHHVTLFASGDSETAAELVSAAPQALRLDPRVRELQPYNLIQLDQVLQRAEEFDIIHFHTELQHFPLFQNRASRTVTTCHGRLDLPDLPAFYRHFAKMPLISISETQRAFIPDVRWVATIHHGLPLELHRLQTQPDGYLAFLGRISPEKGPDRAIEIAKRAGTRLRIAAKVDAVDRAYFEAEIRPLLDHPLIAFEGEIDEREKDRFLGGAAALLFPVDWPEPFGLVAIEAMACGTPVIAFRRGAIPEIVEDGVTGYVVDSVEAAVDAYHRLGELSRERIRARFGERFSAGRMALEHLAAYERLLAAAGDLADAA